jgi:hypothetical protein
VRHLVLVFFFLPYAHNLCSVFNAKQLIGHKFDDPEVQSDIKHFPFTIIKRDGKPYICVSYRGEDKEFVCINLFPFQVTGH